MLNSEPFERQFRELLCAIDREVRTKLREEIEQEVRAEFELRRSDYMTVQELCDELKMTAQGLLNLRQNPAKNFPKPVNFDSNPRWIRAEIMEWAKAHRKPF